MSDMLDMLDECKFYISKIAKINYIYKNTWKWAKFSIFQKQDVPLNTGSLN